MTAVASNAEHHTQPQVFRSAGAVVPGTGGHIAGAGTPGDQTLEAQLEQAAELLRATFDVDVAVRYNNNGRSGGAYVVTETDMVALFGNSRIGINVRLGLDAALVYNVYASVDYLRDPALANCTGIGKYAYPELPSVAAALQWIQTHVNVPAAPAAA